VILGSGVFNGNAAPELLEFINSFDFMDDLSMKVGASFASGGDAASGVQPVLEQINRGLSIFRMIITGGESWRNGEGTGVVANGTTPIQPGSFEEALAMGEGQRVATVAAALKESGGGSPSSSVDAPPGWGETWKAVVSANLTQVGYDAGLVLVNFTAQCGSDPSVQKMKTVYGDFYTVLTRCDLGKEFTIAPASRGSGCTSREIGVDSPARICEACGCPFCVRDTNGTFSHGETSGSTTQWQSKEPKMINGVDVMVWTGRAESSTGGESFDLETSIAYSTTDMTPMFVNVSHPLWVETSAQLDQFSNSIETADFDIPDSCFKG